MQHQFSQVGSIEATYTGRLGRHLMQMRDISTPNDLVDPKSGLDYFAAAKLLSKLTDAGSQVTSVKQDSLLGEHVPVDCGRRPDGDSGCLRELPAVSRQ